MQQMDHWSYKKSKKERILFLRLDKKEHKQKSGESIAKNVLFQFV